jgi:hypothetical protein
MREFLRMTVDDSEFVFSHNLANEWSAFTSAGLRASFGVIAILVSAPSRHKWHN